MKKKIIISSVAVFAIAIACFSAVMASKAKKFDEYMENIQINEADLSGIEDGVYTGKVDSGMIRVMVEVSIANHQIVGIELLEHKNGRGNDANIITGRIVDEQKIKVDTVAGATLSSKVIQKAVEAALKCE